MLKLLPYDASNIDTVYLAFEHVYDDDGKVIPDCMEVEVRKANGLSLGLLCTITPKGIIRSDYEGWDERLFGCFALDDEGRFRDATDDFIKEEF